MNKEEVLSAAAAGTFKIGGNLTVNRLGYGAMRITGPGVWGPPADKEAALATLRKAIDLDGQRFRLVNGLARPHVDPL